jgi:hypothetical protein
MWNIDGKELKTEAELRQYAKEYSPKGKFAFRQDFRLINGARTKGLSELLDLLEKNGAEIKEL